MNKIKNEENLGFLYSKDGKKHFYENIFVNNLLKLYSFYYDETNLWLYENNHLKVLSDTQVKKICKEEFDKINKKLWKLSFENKYFPTLKTSSKLLQKKDFNKFPYKVNFINGVFNFKTQKFEKHSEENNFTYIHDYLIFKEFEDTPLFDELINIVSNGQTELTEYILELMAYIISGNKTEQKFFIFKGSGQNGKSTLINLIRKLIHPDFVTNISISKLDEKFALASAEGKKLIVASENEGKKNNAVSTENLKILSSGNEMINIEKKYQDSYSTMLQVELIFAVNNSIEFAETSYGLTRRLVVIPFDGIITNPDSEFEKNLENEIPLIMRKLIYKYLNIVNRNYKLPSCLIVEEATKALLQESDIKKIDRNLLEYFEEHLELEDIARERKNAIFNHYTNNSGQESQTKFWIEFRKWLKLKEIEYKEIRNTARYICGVRLKTENEE